MIRRIGIGCVALATAAVLLVLALAAYYMTHVDTAGQGVLLLGPVQSAECTVGGGCVAMSGRELRELVQHAAMIGASRTCKGS